MRNLKKILALVLALVMSLSLMAVAGATDTTAAGNPDYQTSATVLQKLRVVVGDAGTGDIRPTAPISRAEVAALLYRIATGDVDDAQANIHTNQPFTDVVNGTWYTGYISYCYNAEIIKGNPDNTFDPNKDISGYATLAMILRAMGYGQKGEFVGDGWEIRTASTAKQIGILEGITDTQLGGSARREMVFEILFRAILKDTVRYNALHEDYEPTGENLAKTKLGLEEIKGVVVANHIADLYDTEPMAEGKTRMIVDGKTYVLNTDTDATAIGLKHHAYVKGGDVLADLVATGNVVAEPEVPGAASKVADLAKANGIKTTAATEYYLNFADTTKSASSYKIKYELVFGTETEALAAQTRINDASGLKSGDGYATLSEDAANKLTVVTRTIPPKTTITSVDLAMMKTIFGERDRWTEGTKTYTDGAVYVGSQSIYDISDVTGENVHYWSFDSFVDEFINETQDAITSSDNGEWLRVIDNNGDGVVDYVLRTDFVMTTVTDYEKRTDVYNVEWKNGSDEGKIPASAIVKASEDTDLSVGSVILYTLIDGNYYVSNPVVETLTVDKKSINSKAGTFTVDGETYTWSGIDEKAVKYYDSVSQLAYETKYDMYPDHFGFIRLATETSRNFVLLTDAYFGTDNRVNTSKIDLYDGENAVYDAQINDHSGRSILYNGGFRKEGFVDTFEDDHKGNASTWLRLNTFGEFYAVDETVADVTPNNYKVYRHYVDVADQNGTGVLHTNVSNGNTYKYYGYTDPFVTNIAMGTENDGVWTLEDVEDLDEQYNGLYREYKTYTLNAGFEFNETDLWGVKSWVNNTKQPIQTNAKTLYYYVENPGTHGENLKVQSWVGYQNRPEELKDDTAKLAYAVTHEVLGSTVDYVIADVVVIEGVVGGAPAADPQLIINGITTKREIALGKDEEGNWGEHDTAFGLFAPNQLKALAVDAYGNIINYANVVPYDCDGLVGPQVTFFDGSYDTKYPDGDHTSEGYIVNNFAKYGIYAGIVTVIDETKDGDYIEMTPSGYAADTRRTKFYTDKVAVFELDQITAYNGNATKNLNTEKVENIKLGDWLIVMKDGDGVTQLVINVSRSSVDGTPYRDGKGNHDDAYAIEKLLDLYKYVVIDQDKQAAATRPAADKIAEAQSIWGNYSAGDSGVTSGELLYAWNLLQTISSAEIAAMTHSEYDAFNTLESAIEDAVIPALLGEEIADWMDALFNKVVFDAIFEVVGDTWDNNEYPDEIVDHVVGDTVYIDADAVLDYDFSNDPYLTQDQIDAIVAILAAYNGVGTSAEAIDISGYGPEDYSTAYEEIDDAIYDLCLGAIATINTAVAGVTTLPEKVPADGGQPISVPKDVDVEKDDTADELEDYVNVTSVWNVSIPGDWDKETVEFSLALPEGQTPYVDGDDLPAGVEDVDFARRPVQTTAMVSAVIWDVTITLDDDFDTDVVVVILVLEAGTNKPILPPSTVVDFMSLSAKDQYGLLSGYKYPSWEAGEEISAVGLEKWLTTADSIEVDEENQTITYTGTAAAIDPTDFTYKNKDINKLGKDFIPLFGYKDYAYYCVVGIYSDGKLVGKGGKNDDGTANVDGYFTLDESKVAMFGTKYALIGIYDKENDWLRFLIVGNFQDESSFKVTIDGEVQTWIVDLSGLTWN